MSAIRKLCNWERCSGNESCGRRRSTFFRGLGISLSAQYTFILIMLADQFLLRKTKWTNLFWFLNKTVIFGVPRQIREEICRTRCLWHAKYFPVTWFSMDPASNIPPRASPPYTSKDSRCILQPRHSIIVMVGTNFVHLFVTLFFCFLGLHVYNKRFAFVCYRVTQSLCPTAQFFSMRTQLDKDSV